MVKRYKTILIFILVFIAVFAFDQWVKSLTLSGLRWQSEY
ncbi:TPA: lipoprotein signal peptidase, partial [Campylobacter coli]|nr:lipoprotein signal peptidase [Campylobacter coli]